MILAACRSTDGPAPPSPGVNVESYEVQLRLDPPSGHVAARARLDVRHPDALAALPLTLDWTMNLRAVRVNGSPVEVLREEDRMTVPLAGGDSSVVELVYYGTIEDGLYHGEVAGQPVTYTDAWPARAAGWLPGVHHPSDPARLDLRLLVPRGYDVAASGVRVAEVDSAFGGGWRRFRYTLATDAPVYTFAFAIADSFAVAEDETASGVPILHHLLPSDAEKARLLARTPAILDTLAALLGPYPYAAYATVQVPMRYAGMENAAAPFLRADLYDDAEGRNAVEEVNVHEAVHQWFGNDVVPADWRELWLAEGFATYLATVVYERLDGVEAARQQRVLMAQLSRAEARRALVPERYDDPEDLLSATVYQKGGVVLHLLRLLLGDEAFFRSLRRLTTEYADRPLSTPALQTLLEAVAGRDLDPFFAYWVYGDTIPTLRTRWDAGQRRLFWEVEGDKETLFGVPYELLVRQGATTRYVAATDGAVTLPGTEQPEIYPVGVVLDVR